jgi:hypothetical protein
VRAGQTAHVGEAARRRRCSDMADLAFIALTVAFFAAVALIARKLDRS